MRVRVLRLIAAPTFFTLTRASSTMMQRVALPRRQTPALAVGVDTGMTAAWMSAVVVLACFSFLACNNTSSVRPAIKTCAS